MTLDATVLPSLAGMNDEIGILSIYADADPRADNTQAPAWHKRVHAGLAAVKDRTKAESSRAEWHAVLKRINALSDELDWLLDRSEPGRGRALFAAVAEGAVERVSLQAPLVDRVVLDSSAHLYPLVAAWSASGPAGVAAVSADATRVIDLRFDTVSEPANIRYEPGPEARELTASAAAQAGLAQHGVARHDLGARRESDRLARRLRGAAADVARFAGEYGWEYVVVTGDSSLTQALVDGLPAGFVPSVVRLDHPVRAVRPPKLAGLVEPALTDARRRRASELVERACDDALSGRAGSCGLPKTLAALQDRRVAHLLLAGDGPWRARRTSDAALVPADDDTPEAQLEPNLGERMVELAFAEGARITIVDPDIAEHHLDDGVGAILRW